MNSEMMKTLLEMVTTGEVATAAIHGGQAVVVRVIIGGMMMCLIPNGKSGSRAQEQTIVTAMTTITTIMTTITTTITTIQ